MFIKKYFKSPLNYVGGKYKLLPQILPLFPDDIGTFYDIFGGGGNVGINVETKNVVINDINDRVIDLFKHWQRNDVSLLINKIDEVIQCYNLSQSSVNGYEYYGCNSNDGLSSYNGESWRKLRADYNSSKDISLLYPLIVFTFNNHIKFNDVGDFVAGGCNKRDFNNALKKRFVEFIMQIHKIKVEFNSQDFKEFRNTKFNDNDLVYCDPPYLITSATYNKDWTELHELSLLDFLDFLHSTNIKFALSNVLESKGKSNDILKEWANKYNIHYLDKNYSNSNYQRKDVKAKDVEVLITNY